MNYSDIMIIFEETIRDMEDLFVTYEQALALKELGFNEKCFAAYRDSEWIGHDGPNSRYFHAQLFSNSMFDDDQQEYCSAPLKSQVFKWFRDKHNINHVIDKHRKFGFWIKLWNNLTCLGEFDEIKTYEEAESACIDKLIEIVKTKKD